MLGMLKKAVTGGPSEAFPCGMARMEELGRDVCEAVERCA